MKIKTDVAIVGAGVIGLAIAAEVAGQGRNVLVFEREHTFGQGISSRQSEIIHGGIYYPTDSLKAKLCLEGNRLLYELCQKHHIPHKRTGKIIVASRDEEVPELEVIDFAREGEGWTVSIRDWEGVSEFSTGVVINCAGLFSDKITRLAGIDRDDYRLHYCKGDYFSLNAKTRGKVSRLIYPVPERAGLGIHLTLAIDGMMRLGPNTRFVEEIDYSVDKSQQWAFYQSARRFIPFIEPDDLSPDYSGIRPKLQGPDETFRDFVINHEESSGFPGLINLIGIESPGLTASPAIAHYVARMVDDIT